MIKDPVLLIVDDNLNFADRMIGLLDDVPGISAIHLAADYEEAKRLFLTVHPCVILLDINLPGRNGIEILTFIKQANIECEVIMITNHVDDYYRQQCLDLGAKHFLDKSNDFALVPGIISEIINGMRPAGKSVL